MKAPISKNIEKILDQDKYDHWIYRTSILPRRLRNIGLDVDVVIDKTELRYFLGKEEVTDVIENIIGGAKKKPKLTP